MKVEMRGISADAEEETDFTCWFSEIFFLIIQLIFLSFVAEWTSNFSLAHKLIWPLWSHLIFSPNKDDLSHSAWMTFTGISKRVKERQTFSSIKSFEQDGRSFCPLFLAAESLQHEERTSNLWTDNSWEFIPSSFVTFLEKWAARSIKLDVLFRL